MTGKRTLMAAACLLALPMTGRAATAPAATATASAPDVVIDGRTERVLDDACAFLRSAERFAVDVSVSYDDVLKSGKKAQYQRETSIVLERPNRLRGDGESDKGTRSGFYVGTKLTVYRPDRALYAAFDAPATIDATLASAMQGYWTGFATKGKPKSKGFPGWPRFKTKSWKMLGLTGDFTKEKGYRQAECTFWRGLYESGEF